MFKVMGFNGIQWVDSQWVDKPSNCKGCNLLGSGGICYPRDVTQWKRYL